MESPQPYWGPGYQVITDRSKSWLGWGASGKEKYPPPSDVYACFSGTALPAWMAHIEATTGQEAFAYPVGLTWVSDKRPPTIH